MVSRIPLIRVVRDVRAQAPDSRGRVSGALTEPGKAICGQVGEILPLI